MTEQTKKIIVPPFLLRRFEAFRIVKGDAQSYLIRDKIQDKVYDFDLWQFFILEVLPGCESLEKLQTVFQDRFDRTLTPQDLDVFFGSLADRRMLDEAAEKHPLLAPYMRRTYTVEDGKATPKPFAGAAAATASASMAAPAAGAAAAPASKAAAGGGSAAGASKVPGPEATATRDRAADLPAGVQDALGLDWRTTDKMIGLFDPRPLLRLLAPVLKPFYYVIYAVPMLLVAALFLAFKFASLLGEDLVALHPQTSLFAHLVFVLFTVHVVTTFTAAAVASHYKVSVDKVGITLTFGFMPRWVLKMTGAERLTRIQTMWLHGATLIARLLMFSLGVLVWYNTRDSQGSLPQVGLLLMFSCGVGLLIESGNPLVKANCYYLVSAYLNEPHLRGKAYAALLNKLKGGVYKAADNSLLALYALMSGTYIVIITLICAWMLAKYVLGDLALGGSAILLTLGFAGFMLWRNYVGLKKFGETFERQVQFDRWRQRTLPMAGAGDGEIKVAKTNYWPRALVFCLLLALFLPYPYEPGGPFSVFPVRKAQLTTDTPGVIAEVAFDGGEAVKAGTVLAQLAHDDYKAQQKTLEAQMEEQRHIIANLKSLPKPEEVQVAQQQLDVAKAHAPFSLEKMRRLEKLYPLGAVSLEELDAARKEHQVDLEQITEKTAALALAKTGPTKEQIAAAEARLLTLTQERDGVAARIERTTIRMPFDGNILTLHLKDRINSYLDKGLPFAEVENTGTVTMQIQVTEADLQYVKLGAGVRVRPSSYFYDEFEGKVTLIDRNVTKKPIGNVVNVIATFDNQDGRLKTGMTGEAKIAAVTIPVWQAYTQSMVRFIRLQVWSWLP